MSCKCPINYLPFPTNFASRGKKVYRRFDDSQEEEEVIDDEDLGLLEHLEDGGAKVKPLKTLTRKSIKPTRLFQTEQQKLARDLAREDEAVTDIEDDASPPTSGEHVTQHVDKDSSKEVNGKASSNGIEKPARASPFDAWRRVKGGSRTGSASKGQKRSAAEAMGEEDISAPVTSNMRQKRARA